MIEIIPNWHPIFVHFSVGLLVVSALFHVAVMLASNESSKQALTHVANWNLWLGTLITVATVAAGWIAFNSVDHDTPSHLAMIEHRNWAMATFASYVAVGLWSLLRAKKHKPLQWPLVAAVCAAGLLLMSTAWHGGELVYRHGLGVMSLPNTDDHAHEEGAAHDHGEHPHEDLRSEQQEHSHGHDHETVDQSASKSDTVENTAPVSEASDEAIDKSDQTQHEHADEPGHEHHNHKH